MAKEQEDRTTIDLFIDEKRPGRPKTSTLSREMQLRVNKRNQLKRDRRNGLKRVELKLDQHTVEFLDDLVKQKNTNRSKLIEDLLLSIQAEHEK